MQTKKMPIGRVYPRKVLDREIENYSKAVKERRALGECVPAGHEILTVNKGWMDIKDIHPGEEIYTLNLTTNEIEVQKTEEKIDKKYKDDLVRIHNSSGDYLFTKNHKIVLWSRYGKPYTMTAIELHEAIKRDDSRVNHSHIKRAGEWKGEEPEYFQIPGTKTKIKTEDWAAFLGIYITEGHCAGTKGR